MLPVLNFFLNNIFVYYLFLLFQYNIPYYKNHIKVIRFYNGKLNYNLHRINNDQNRVIKICYHNYG